MNTCSNNTDGQESRRNKFGFALQAAVVAVVASFFLATLRDGHEWGGDFSQYISHAKNIASGRPYADTGYVYNPIHPEIGPRAYPPVFPLSLAPAYAAFGFNLTAFKIQLVVVFVLSLWVTVKLFSSSLGDKQLLAYLIAIGFCPIFWIQKDAVDSEHLFILLWYLTILVADQWYRRRHVVYSRSVHAILLGVLIYLTYGTRTVGIVLLPTVVLCELITTKRLTRFGATVIAMACGLILVEKAILPSSGAGYLEQLSSIDRDSILENLWTDVVAFSTIWENGYSEQIRKVAGVLLTLVGIVGFCRENLPRPSFLGIAMGLYFALVVVWPSASWIRMVLPLFPAFLFYVLLGMDLPSLPKLVRQSALACFCLFSIVSYAAWYSRANFGLIDGVATPSAVELFQFVRDNTQEDDVCLFFKPRVLCLYTGRQATAYPSDDHERETWDYAKSTGVELVIVRYNPDNREKWSSISRAEEEMMRHCDELVEVWRNDSFRAYRGPWALEQDQPAGGSKQNDLQLNARL